MKKRIYILGLLVLFMTASCGSSGWSCKKRYCSTPTKTSIETITNNCVAELENPLVTPQ